MSVSILYILVHYFSTSHNTLSFIYTYKVWLQLKNMVLKCVGKKIHRNGNFGKLTNVLSCIQGTRSHFAFSFLYFLWVIHVYPQHTWNVNKWQFIIL